MEESYPCGRKISHKCRYQEKSKLIIIANDYSDFEPIPTLSAAINDVSMIWNLFRRHFCFHEDQIFVYGQVNIGGKMIAWRKRFNLPTEFTEQTYFYYSGHGYNTGKLDINPKIEAQLIKASQVKLYLIIDACFSHLWHVVKKDNNSSSFAFIGATNCDRDVAGSTKLISAFTLDLAKYLTRKNKAEGKDNLLKDFEEWIKEQQYTFQCSQEDLFVKDILN